MSENSSWVIKYAPKCVSEIVGNEESVHKLVSWLLGWDRRKEGIKRGALLAGPAGVGKTSSIYAFAQEKNWEVQEYNASDLRNKAAFEQIILLSALTKSLVANDRPKIILLDEVDGIHGTKDKGGMRSLTNLLSVTRWPIVMTCNNLYSKKIRSLRQKVLVIEYKHHINVNIARILSKILNEEGIEANPKILKAIALNSGGDLRAAINDLENMAYGKQRLEISTLPSLKIRDRKIGIFQAMEAIFRSTEPIEVWRKSMNIDVDYRMFLRWIYENAYLYARSSEELANMYQKIAHADLILGRIIWTQNWKLLKYFYVTLTVGLNTAKTSPYSWRKAQRPYWGSRKKMPEGALEIYSKLKKGNHQSLTKVAGTTYPYLEFIFETNPQMAAEIAYYYNFSTEALQHLPGKKRRSIVSRIKKLQAKDELEKTKTKEIEVPDSPKGSKKRQKKKKAPIKDTTTNIVKNQFLATEEDTTSKEKPSTKEEKKTVSQGTKKSLSANKTRNKVLKLEETTTKLTMKNKADKKKGKKKISEFF